MIRDLLKKKSMLDAEKLEIAVKVGKDLLAELMKSVTKMLNSSMELDEFSEIYTKPLDKIILSEEEKNELKFIGGEFKIFYIDDRSFGCSYSLYFQNDKEAWQKMSAKSDSMDNYYLSENALQELVEKRTIVYAIEPPTEEARLEYEKEKENGLRTKRIE